MTTDQKVGGLNPSGVALIMSHLQRYCCGWFFVVHLKSTHILDTNFHSILTETDFNIIQIALIH